MRKKHSGVVSDLNRQFVYEHSLDIVLAGQHTLSNSQINRVFGTALAGVLRSMLNIAKGFTCCQQIQEFSPANRLCDDYTTCDKPECLTWSSPGCICHHVYTWWFQYFHNLRSAWKTLIKLHTSNWRQITYLSTKETRREPTSAVKPMIQHRVISKQLQCPIDSSTPRTPDQRTSDYSSAKQHPTQVMQLSGPHHILH